MKLARDIRRYIQEDVATGTQVVNKVLESFQLTHDEATQPWKHRKSLEEKRAIAQEINIPKLWEAMVGSLESTVKDPQGWNETSQLLESVYFKKKIGQPLLSEAEVASSAFTLLTSAKLFTTMMARYELQDAAYLQLFGVFDSPYEKYEHQIPSDAPEMVNIREGEEYPEAQLSDRFCETKANKFGRRISITRETMLRDKTSQVVSQAEGLAANAKYREDELAAKCFQDSSNSDYVVDANNQDAGAYWPERTNKALYRSAAVTTGTLQNYQYAVNLVASNPLSTWKNLAKALKTLMSMKNYQNQFIDTIGQAGLTIVVPFSLAQRANLLASPSAMVQIDQNLAAGTESAFVRVPEYLRSMTGGAGTMKVLSWNKLDNEATDENSKWYLCGNSKEQFKKHQVWPAEFNRATAAQMGGDDYKRDVIVGVRGGLYAGFRAVDDKFVIRNKYDA